MNKTKVALVTGGSSGIGLAIAQRFVKEGYQTIICGRNAEKLNKAVDLLGKGCIGINFDVGNLNEIPNFVSSIIQKYGEIDVLVNNAGVNLKKELVKVTDEDFNNIVRVNQTAIFSLSREVAKSVINKKMSAAIINISSMASHYGIPKVIAYTASKSALEGMTRAMAVELSPLGIRVNCVAPGFIKTPMSSKALNDDPERKNKVLSRTPLARLGDTSEVANVVYFLASEESSFITGETIKVDGGNAIGF